MKRLQNIIQLDRTAVKTPAGEFAVFVTAGAPVLANLMTMIRATNPVRRIGDPSYEQTRAHIIAKSKGKKDGEDVIKYDNEVPPGTNDFEALVNAIMSSGMDGYAMDIVGAYSEFMLKNDKQLKGKTLEEAFGGTPVGSDIRFIAQHYNTVYPFMKKRGLAESLDAINGQVSGGSFYKVNGKSGAREGLASIGTSFSAVDSELPLLRNSMSYDVLTPGQSVGSDGAPIPANEMTVKDYLSQVTRVLIHLDNEKIASLIQGLSLMSGNPGEMNLKMIEYGEKMMGMVMWYRYQFMMCVLKTMFWASDNSKIKAEIIRELPLYESDAVLSDVRSYVDSFPVHTMFNTWFRLMIAQSADTDFGNVPALGLPAFMMSLYTMNGKNIAGVDVDEEDQMGTIAGTYGPNSLFRSMVNQVYEITQDKRGEMMMQMGKLLGGVGLASPSLSLNLLNPDMVLCDGWESSDRLDLQRLFFSMIYQPEADTQGSAYIDGVVTEKGPSLDEVQLKAPVKGLKEIMFPNSSEIGNYETKTGKLDLMKINRPVFLVPINEQSLTAEKYQFSMQQQRMMGRFPEWMSPSLTMKEMIRIDDLDDLARTLAVSKEFIVKSAPWDNRDHPWHVYFSLKPRFTGDVAIAKAGGNDIYLSTDRLAITTRGNQIINSRFVILNNVLPGEYYVYLHSLSNSYIRRGIVFTRTVVEPFLELASTNLSGVPYGAYTEVLTMVEATEMRLDVSTIMETIRDVADA